MPADTQRGKIVLGEMFQRMAPRVRRIHVPTNQSRSLIAGSAMHNFEMKGWCAYAAKPDRLPRPGPAAAKRALARAIPQFRNYARGINRRRMQLKAPRNPVARTYGNSQAVALHKLQQVGFAQQVFHHGPGARVWTDLCVIYKQAFAGIRKIGEGPTGEQSVTQVVFKRA